MVNLNKAKALTVNRLSFLKENEKRIVAELIASPYDLLYLKIEDLSFFVNRRLKTKNWNPSAVLSEAENDFVKIQNNDFDLCISTESGYPKMLAEIYDPPYVLYVRGNKEILHQSSCAIVGTRRPHNSACASAYMWAMDLCKSGIVVVSGLALGVDTAAHKGAVAAQSPTVAVLGTGIDSLYPVRNRKLAYDILVNGGAVVSEFPPGTPAKKYNFPRRNRIISGLSKSVLLIQAPEKSGALITADFALDQGREVFVDRNCINLPFNEGCVNLQSCGAQSVAFKSELNIPLQTENGMFEYITGINKHKFSAGKEIAHIMELELTGKVLRYNNNFFKVNREQM